MSLTLKAAITATQTTVDIAGSDALSEGDVRSIDSEYVEIRSAAQATLQYGETAYYRATIKRGVQGTAKATHAAAAALTAVLPGSGTGAVDSVNGATGVVVLVAEDVGAAADDDARLSDTRTPTAHAASHENGGADEIDVTGLTGAGGEQTVYVQTTDPGAVGAGKLWVDTTEDAANVRRRNFADDGWVDLFESYQAVSGVQIQGVTGGVGESGGDAVLVGGPGNDSSTGSGMVTAGGGTASEAGSVAIRTKGVNGSPGQVLIRHEDGGLGYGELADIANEQPEVPATPTEQDIVDALLALGLVTQAAP